MVSSITSKLPSVAVARAPKVKGGKGKKTSLNQDDDDQDDATSFASVMSNMAKLTSPAGALTSDAQTAQAQATPTAADRLAARDLVRRK